MPTPHTNLRELIPKWRGGHVTKTSIPRDQVKKGNYFELDGKLCRALCVFPSFVTYREVDIQKRRLASDTGQAAHDEKLIVLCYKRG